MVAKRYFICNIGPLHGPDLEIKLHEYFSQFGAVKEIFIRDQKGFGFVNIDAKEDLPKKHTLDGHDFKIDLAKPKGAKQDEDIQRYFVAGIAKLEENFDQNTRAILKTYFEANGGNVTEVFVRHGKGFAFVSASGIEQSFLAKNEHEIEGFEVKIDAAKPKAQQEQPERRFGGRRFHQEGPGRWDYGYEPMGRFRRPMRRQGPSMASFERFQEKYYPEEPSYHQVRARVRARYGLFDESRPQRHFDRDFRDPQNSNEYYMGMARRGEGLGRGEGRGRGRDRGPPSPYPSQARYHAY